jgi:hypothetical protein
VLIPILKHFIAAAILPLAFYLISPFWAALRVVDAIWNMGFEILDSWLTEITAAVPVFWWVTPSVVREPNCT